MDAAAVVARASDLCSNPHHLKVSGACSMQYGCRTQGSQNPLARSPRRVQTMSGLVQSQEVPVRWATNLF